MAKWLKFANGLKLKMGLMLADVDAATSKTMVEAAAKGVFSSNSDNTALTYYSNVPNTNPIWVDLIQSGRKDYVPANTVVDLMNNLSDPRRSVFFGQLNGKYVGGSYLLVVTIPTSRQLVMYSKTRPRRFDYGLC
jgi:hypothetical protein